MKMVKSISVQFTDGSSVELIPDARFSIRSLTGPNTAIGAEWARLSLVDASVRFAHARWPAEVTRAEMMDLLEPVGRVSADLERAGRGERKPPVIEVEVKTSPLAGYMAGDGRTYCPEHASAMNGWIDRIGAAAAEAADISCAICGEKLAAKVEIKTSPLVGYMTKEQSWCLRCELATPGSAESEMVSEAMARAADMFCVICGKKLAK